MNDSSPLNKKIQQPVVFFPGTLCDERVFMPCWQYLDIPFQAYVPLQWAEDLEQMKALAHDRLAYFDEPVHLVGFSMGGYIAALTALEAPEKVASLTLIGNTCQPLPESELKQRRSLLSALKNAKFKGMSELQIAGMLHADNTSNLEVIQTIRDMELDLGMPTLSKQMLATSKRKNLLPQLNQSPFEVRFVAGEDDKLATIASLCQAQQGVTGSQLEFIAKAGHMLPIEQAEKLAEYLARTLCKTH